MKTVYVVRLGQSPITSVVPIGATVKETLQNVSIAWDYKVKLNGTSSAMDAVPEDQAMIIVWEKIEWGNR